MSSLERYNKRKLKLNNLPNTVAIIKAIDQNMVNNFLCSKADMNLVTQTTQIIESHYKFEYDFNVSAEEAKEFLEKFKNDFNQERFDKLITDCKKDVINSIVTPFGLGKIVAAYDKVGGNVTTVHNANNKEFIDSDGKKYKGGIYSKAEDAYERTKYTHSKNSNGQQFAGAGQNSVGSQFTRSKMDEEGNVIDAYTGKSQKADTTSPDHKYSNSQYHKDGGFMQDSVKKADFSTDTDNLALTDRKINQSMRDFDKEQWKDKVDDEGVRNEEKFEIDADKLKAEMQQAKETSENHLPTNTEKAIYYAKNSAITGINEGSKMGMQQAIGLVMTEFFTALFDEILDIYKEGFSSGFDDDRFFKVLQERLKRIAKRIEEKWKDIAIAFKDGFLSGFISNLVTTAINMFVTTGKRLIRIIREGIFALLKAIKIVLFPPENLSYEEAIHEAKKIFATGAIISLGVITEQYIDTLIKGTVVLEPFADVLTAIFVGAITGLAVTMTVYYIDKQKNDKEAMRELIIQTNTKFDNAEKLLSELNRYGSAKL